MGRRAKRRRWDWEFTPAENRRRAEAKANYKSMAATPFWRESKMPTDPAMPQPKWFFVYILRRDNDEPEPLKTCVIAGFDRAAVEQTRTLVQSGAQMDRLLYLSDVSLLEPHHSRRVRSLIEPDGPGDDNTFAYAAEITGGKV